MFLNVLYLPLISAVEHYEADVMKKDSEAKYVILYAVMRDGKIINVNDALIKERYATRKDGRK